MLFLYVCDADSIINIKDAFSAGYNALRRHARNGELKIPRGVYNDLRRGSDALAEKVLQWEKSYDAVETIRPGTSWWSDLGRIESKYGPDFYVEKVLVDGFWRSKAGRGSADGQVVCIGRAFKSQGSVVVSDDKAVRCACMLEDVACIGWTEFARQIGILRGS